MKISLTAPAQAYREHRNKEKRYEAAIEAKQAKLDKLRKSKKHYWKTAIVDPLAEILREALGYETVNVSGPYGLGSECYVTFNEDKESEVYFVVRPDYNNPQNLIGISVKSNVSTGNYEDNTIGAVNGFNYESIIPPANVTPEWFKQFLKKDLAV